MHKPKDELEEYDRKVIGQIPWLRPRLTLEGNQESAPHPAARIMVIIETVSQVVCQDVIAVH